MKEENIIYMKVKAESGSALEKVINTYIQNLSLLRKKRKELYNNKVDKQIKKVERSGI